MRVLVYNPSGILIDELNPSEVTRSWELYYPANGKAEIVVPKYAVDGTVNPKLKRDNFRAGNWVLILADNDVLPWAGYITKEPATTEGRDTLTFYCHSAEHILNRRVAPFNADPAAIPGACFRRAIQLANVRQSTLLRFGSAVDTGKPYTMPGSFVNLLEYVNGLATSTGNVWWGEPSDLDGRLAVSMFFGARGDVTQYVITDRTLSVLGDPILVESGNPINAAVEYLIADNPADTRFSEWHDNDASQIRHGRWEAAYEHTDPEHAPTNLGNIARGLVATYPQPRYTLSNIAVTGGFAYVRPGNIIYVNLPRYGWTGSERGITRKGIVTAAEYNDNDQRMALVIDLLDEESA